MEVFLYGDPEKLPPDARVNWERWNTRGSVRPLNFPSVSEDDEQSVYHAIWIEPKRAGEEIVCIDALFGTGLSRGLSGLRPVLHLFDECWGFFPNVHIVSLDLPTGISADSGEVVGGPETFAIRADLTVAFHSKKVGHAQNAGLKECGTVRVVDIGLPGCGRD